MISLLLSAYICPKCDHIKQLHVFWGFKVEGTNDSKISILIEAYIIMGNGVVKKIQWKKLIVITLGQRESNNINWMIIISDLLQILIGV